MIGRMSKIGNLGKSANNLNYKAKSIKTISCPK